MWADSFEGSEQEEYAGFLTALRIVERASGWRLTDDDEASLVVEAAYYGVDRTGRVVVPARITEDELDEALIRLAPRSTAALDRPRPAGLTTCPQLTELVELLATRLPADRLPATQAWTLSSGSVGTAGEPAVPDADRDRASELALELYEALGDDASGHPMRVAVHIDAERRATVDLRFDSLPDDGSGSMRTFGWEDYIVRLSERDPAWVPEWVPDALGLLRAAGRNV